MARPKKLTVDYFPHIIKQGKTMTILENRFGNDGYAFWFKLLEILGSTEGHSYRYENITDIEFLLAKTKVDEETAENILNLLAELGAIDKDLWENRIIWSDNFIENVADVYSKRSTELPEKPVIGEEMADKEGFPEEEVEEEEVSGEKTIQFGEKTPQSKLKKTKLKESKQQPCIAIAYEKVFARLISPYQHELLQAYVVDDGMDPEVVIKAILIAGENNAKSLKYVTSILDNWRDRRVKTLEDAEKAIREFELEKQERSRSSPGKNRQQQKDDLLQEIYLEAEG